MTTKSAAKSPLFKEGKSILQRVAVWAVVLFIFAGLFFYFWVSSSGWLFYKTQSIYGNLIAPLFFFVISLALLRNLWEKRAEDRKDRVRRVIGLAVFGFFIIIGFTYSLDPKMSWSFYALKDKQGNLIALVFFVLLLLCGVWWSIAKSNKKQWATESAALLGLFAMDFIYSVKTWAPDFFTIIQDKGKYLITPMFLLLAPAPLSFYLWLCRNEDKLKQITQTDEQNKFNSFSDAMRLFLEKDGETHAKAVGLRILAKIRKESKAFRAEIDMATPGVNLEEGDLTDADLTNIDLSRAILIKAKLTNANLIGTTLTGTDLTSAGMFDADLTKANLKNAILNDILVGVHKKHLYKGGKENKFSRADIENYLKKDLEKRKSPAQVREKKENNAIYYCFEAVTDPSHSTTGISTSSVDDSSSTPTDVPPPPGGSPPPPPTDLPPTPAGPSPTPTNLPPAPAAAEIAPTAQTDSSNQEKALHYGLRETDPSARATGESADAYFNQGKAKLEINDFDGAIKDFDKAIKLDPGHAGAYRLSAYANLRKGME